MNKQRFEALKEEILKRAIRVEACSLEYEKAEMAEEVYSLMSVLRKNFKFAIANHVIDKQLISMYEDEFKAGEIYHNQSTSSGCVLLTGNDFFMFNGNAVVMAYENVTISANDIVTVYAYNDVKVHSDNRSSIYLMNRSEVCAKGFSKVLAREKSKVVAWGESRIIAKDSSVVDAKYHTLVFAEGRSVVNAEDYVSVRAKCKSKVNASGMSNVYAVDDASLVMTEQSKAFVGKDVKVYASGESYITSEHFPYIELKEGAIFRRLKQNIIFGAEDGVLLKYREGKES